MFGISTLCQWWVYRGGTRMMVRANRYALAAALEGKALEPWVRALHGCNNLACVRVSLTDEIGLLHVVPGTQRDNMLMMARAGRGGGRVAIRRGDNGVKARRARAVALREAVRNGWDAAASRPHCWDRAIQLFGEAHVARSGRTAASGER